jgi:hypothetical protein
MNRKAALIAPLLIVVAVSVLVMPTVACWDKTPPVIEAVYQQPTKDNVHPDDKVEVYANVTDKPCGCGVKQVLLNYTNDNGTWTIVDMTNLEGKVWNATIPAFPYCTNVTYVIIAEDYFHNSITTEKMGYEYKYHVIPEFPTWTSMLIILIMLTVATAIYKRRLLKTTTH